MARETISRILLTPLLCDLINVDNLVESFLVQIREEFSRIRISIRWRDDVCRKFVILVSSFESPADAVPPYWLRLDCISVDSPKQDISLFSS